MPDFGDDEEYHSPDWFRAVGAVEASTVDLGWGVASQADRDASQANANATADYIQSLIDAGLYTPSGGALNFVTDSELHPTAPVLPAFQLPDTPRPFDDTPAQPVTEISNPAPSMDENDYSYQDDSSYWDDSFSAPVDTAPADVSYDDTYQGDGSDVYPDYTDDGSQTAVDDALSGIDWSNYGLDNSQDFSDQEVAALPTYADDGAGEDGWIDNGDGTYTYLYDGTTISEDSPLGPGTYENVQTGALVDEQGNILFTKNDDGTYSDQYGQVQDFWGVLGLDSRTDPNAPGYDATFAQAYAAAGGTGGDDSNVIIGGVAVPAPKGSTIAPKPASTGGGGGGGSGSGSTSTKPNTPSNPSTGAAPKKTVVSDTRVGNDRVITYNDGSRQVVAGYYAPKSPATAPQTTTAPLKTTVTTSKPATLADVLTSAGHLLGTVLSPSPGTLPQVAKPGTPTSASVVTGRVITTADGSTTYFNSSGKQITAAQYAALQKATTTAKPATASSPLILAGLAAAAWAIFS